MNGVMPLHCTSRVLTRDAVYGEGLLQRHHDFMVVSMQSMARAEGRAIIYPSLVIREMPDEVVDGVRLTMRALTLPLDVVWLTPASTSWPLQDGALGVTCGPCQRSAERTARLMARVAQAGARLTAAAKKAQEETAK